jgi:hypothetical protein
MPKITLPVIQGRKCDGCTVCCTALAVEDLGKPYYVRCEHLKEGGCGIYPTRPNSCKTYQCVWLQGCPILTDADRPDKSGYLINMEADDLGVWVEFFFIRDTATIDTMRVAELAAWFFKFTVPALRGVRFIKNNMLVATDFVLNATKYPDEGEGKHERTWGTHDDVFFMLDALERKRTTPL